MFLCKAVLLLFVFGLGLRNVIRLYVHDGKCFFPRLTLFGRKNSRSTGGMKAYMEVKCLDASLAFVDFDGP